MLAHAAYNIAAKMHPSDAALPCNLLTDPRVHLHVLSQANLFGHARAWGLEPKGGSAGTARALGLFCPAEESTD